MKTSSLLLSLVICFYNFASYGEELEVYSTLNADQKKLATELYNQVKCPTCNGQYIKESNTPSAKILRDEIASQIQNGKSVEEVKQNIISQFGKEIVNSSRYSNADFLVWALPVLFLLALLVKLKNFVKL